MGEILVANFLTFLDAVRDVPYDLWIADEGWDVDYFLHENPELKSAPYVWLTDFVGMLPMLPNEEFQTADNNAEMIEQIARFPRVRDLALFVGQSGRHRPRPLRSALASDPRVDRSPLPVPGLPGAISTLLATPIARRYGSASASRRASQWWLPRLEAPVSAAICWSGSLRRLLRSERLVPGLSHDRRGRTAHRSRLCYRRQLASRCVATCRTCSSNWLPAIWHSCKAGSVRRWSWWQPADRFCIFHCATISSRCATWRIAWRITASAPQPEWISTT